MKTAALRSSYTEIKGGSLTAWKQQRCLPIALKLKGHSNIMKMAALPFYYIEINGDSLTLWKRQRCVPVTLKLKGTRNKDSSRQRRQCANVSV